MFVYSNEGLGNKNKIPDTMHALVRCSHIMHTKAVKRKTHVSTLLLLWLNIFPTPFNQHFISKPFMNSYAPLLYSLSPICLLFLICSVIKIFVLELRHWRMYIQGITILDEPRLEILEYDKDLFGGVIRYYFDCCFVTLLIWQRRAFFWSSEEKL